MSSPSKQGPGIGLLAALTIALTVGPLVIYGLGALSPFIIADLGISTAQFGSLATVVFTVAGLLALVQGRLAAVITPRVNMLIIFGGPAIALTLAALSPNLATMLVAMAVYGASLAMGNPGTNVLIARYVQPERRSSWIGIKQSGTQVGQLIAGAVFPPLALLLNWRIAVASSIVLCFLGLAYAWRQVGSLPPWHPTETELEDPLAPGKRGRRRARPLSRSLWLYAAIAFTTGAGTQATSVYLVLFAISQVNITIVVAGAALAFSGAVGILSRVFLGRWLARRWGTRRTLVALAIGGALGGCVMLAAGALGLTVLFWAAVVMHGSFALSSLVVLMSGVVEETDVDDVGRASGRVSVGLYLGNGVGPLVTGLVVGATGSLLEGWLVVVAAFVLATALSVWLVTRRD